MNTTIIFSKNARIVLSSILLIMLLIWPRQTLQAQAAPIEQSQSQHQLYLPLISTNPPAPPVPAGRIVYMGHKNHNSEIYSINTDGTDGLQLTNTDSSLDDQEPAWSSDRSKVAFYRITGTGRDTGIHTMNADGSNLVRLSTVGWLDTSPNWSPDGSKIIFATKRFGATQLMVMNTDGSDETQLTDFQSSKEPHWSPDGSKIVYSSNAYELGNARFEIYVMDGDGSNKTRLTVNPTSDDFQPRWSPDGTRILFTSYRAGSARTFVMNADGTGIQQVTNVESINPDWSPDGQSLVFIAGAESTNSNEIFIMGLDGSNLYQVTHTADVLEFNSRWIR